MTIAELIEKLQQYPAGMKVVLSEQTGLADINEIRDIEIVEIEGDIWGVGIYRRKDDIEMVIQAFELSDERVPALWITTLPAEIVGQIIEEEAKNAKRWKKIKAETMKKSAGEIVEAADNNIKENGVFGRGTIDNNTNDSRVPPDGRNGGWL